MAAIVSALRARPSRAVLTAASAVLVTSAIGGFYLGRARSISYEDRYKTEKRLQAFVYDNARASRPFVFAKRTDDLGRVTQLSLTSAPVHFVCGSRTFTYDGNVGAVHVTATPPSVDPGFDASKIGRNAVNLAEFDRTLGFMIGGTSAYAVTGTVNKFSALWQVASREDRIRMAVYSSAAAVSGFLLGFYAGYSDQPQCTAEPFQEAVRDPLFWQPIFASLVQEQTWTFDYSGVGTLPVVSSSGGRRLQISGAPFLDPDFRSRNRDSFTSRPAGWEVRLHLLEPGYYDFTCLVDNLIDAGEFRLATKFNLLLSHTEWPVFNWLSDDLVKQLRHSRALERLGGCGDRTWQYRPRPFVRQD